MFFDKKLSKSSKIYFQELGLYPSITKIVENNNALIHKRHNYNESCITAKITRGTQKVEIYLANE